MLHLVSVGVCVGVCVWVCMCGYVGVFVCVNRSLNKKYPPPTTGSNYYVALFMKVTLLIPIYIYFDNYSDVTFSYNAH